MKVDELSKAISAGLASVRTEADCGEFHRKWLGKDGELTRQLMGLKDIDPSLRKEVGGALNTLKRSSEVMLQDLQMGLRNSEIRAKLMADRMVDITVPDLGREVGRLHPITRVTREVVEVFRSMGFHIEDGPEIATDFECFQALNIPEHHPARDMQDTFWLSNGSVLRTHTSAYQHHLLKKYGAGGHGFSALVPGRCYRNENLDATHEMAFFQVEGMMVGAEISIANLIYFMKTALSSVFKKDIKVRLRPGFFSFVEPGFELDASCLFCDEGCGICKKSGWIEFCGCGMIHPSVLEMAGLDPNAVQGFAFGFGLTRLAMMKYGIDDIRVLNGGVLEQLEVIG